MAVLDVVAGVLLVVGSGFILLAAVGVLRFTDTFSRMHAAAKAPALGVIGLGVGAALAIRTSQAVVAAVLVVVLQLIAGPVSAHLLGRAVYRRARPDLQGPDELREAADGDDIDGLDTDERDIADAEIAEAAGLGRPVADDDLVDPEH